MRIRATWSSVFSQQRGYRLRCFREHALLWVFTVIIFLIVLPTVCLGQLVEVPCNGSASGCASRREEFCKKSESVAANLSVPKKTKIWGLLIDPSGAPFAHPENGLTVELRAPQNREVVSSSRVSEMGTFDLGAVAPGTYRLIAVLIIDVKQTRYRGWVQSHSLACGESDECTLAVLLRPSGTDNPIDFCPPK